MNEDITKDLKKRLFYQNLMQDFRTLIRANVLHKRKVASIEGYEKVVEEKTTYNFSYKLHKKNDESMFALISPLDFKDQDGNEYTIYELDYTDESTVKNLVEEVNKLPDGNSNGVAAALRVLGWGLIIIGVFISLFVAEEGFMYFIITLISGVASGLILLGLAEIIKYLKRIEEKVK